MAICVIIVLVSALKHKFLYKESRIRVGQCVR